ncbi:MAG: BlaI/MecI/CopY family transcriptional regulator [Dysgonamonadaceae bacterium]|jgi:predicted transcriptional regulator|nr:BlaI/MecI/CopY family transcriptional regulator [Dysgonamonadaceae bacterium]
MNLTKKEEEIMHFFWEKGPLFVKEIQTFYEELQPHINTLSTMVRILEEKGMVGHESFGKTYRYHALVDKNEFSKKTLKGIIHKYFDNSYLGAVSSLIREENLPLDELRKLIDEVEQTHSK